MTTIATTRGGVKKPASRALLVASWGTLGLLLVPLAVAVHGLPWLLLAPPWLLPWLLLLGLASGAAAVRLAPARGPWGGVGVALPILFAGSAMGVLAVLLGLALPLDLVLADLPGALALAVLLPLLVGSLAWGALRAGLAWLSVSVVAVLALGALDVTRAALTPLGEGCLVWLVGAACLFLGVIARVRRAERWAAVGIAPEASVTPARTARGILGWAVAAMLVALVPLVLGPVGGLTQWWQQLALGRPVTAGHPAAGPTRLLVGQPLALDAPLVLDGSVLATYQILGLEGDDGQPLAAIPPFFAAGLDAYRDGVWTSTIGAAPTVAATPVLAAGPHGGTPATPAGVVEVAITLVGMPPLGETGPVGGLALDEPLVALDAPMAFSVPTRALSSSAAGRAEPLDPLGVCAWVTAVPPASGAHYVALSRALGVTEASGVPRGTLAPALGQALTAVPPADAALLRSLAASWRAAGGASAQDPPALQAEALAQAAHKLLTLDAPATAPASPLAGADAVQASLAARHGDLLTLTTDYVLLGRSLGLPLRLAEGYLAGANNAIHANDATVWAQLAVPGLGWLSFFPASPVITVPQPVAGLGGSAPPTPASRSAVVQARAPTSAQQASASGGTGRTGSGASTMPPSPPPVAFDGTSVLVLGVLLLLVGALVLLLIVLPIMRRRRWLAALPFIVALMLRIGLLAQRVHAPLTPSDTPREATAKLSRALDAPAADALARLTVPYEACVYGGEAVGEAPTLREQWHLVVAALRRLGVRQFAARAAKHHQQRGTSDYATDATPTRDK